LKRKKRRGDANEGCTQGGGKMEKKKKAKCAHVKIDRRDGTAPSYRGIYLRNMSPPNGEDKRDNKEGEGTTESTVRE
jgi:hypothetical protein